MAKPKKNSKAKVKVEDLSAKANPKGGDGEVVARKAGKGQQEYLVVKMNDVIITGVS